jgi:ABC-2 type transport system ATP-binding protein
MIRVEGVSKRYGKTVAVDNLTFHAAPGEVFGLLGPNGAGKTTTLKMLAGLLIPSGGTVSVNGCDLAVDPIGAKMASGFVPDKPFIYEKLTGREFLEFIRELYRVHNVPKALAIQERLIDLFHLTDWLDELTESYSHGMRQKLIITAALCHQPKALIIDEPMVGLDAKGMRQVKDLMRSLADNGATVLLSTHTMSVAEQVCDRIGILFAGKLIATGTFAQLQEHAGIGDADLETIFLKLTEESRAP